jgi:hypothetical protein
MLLSLGSMNKHVVCMMRVEEKAKPAWRWERHVPLKRRLTFSELHGVISHVIELKVKLSHIQSASPSWCLASTWNQRPIFHLEIFFRQLRVCYFVALSLTRGRVCNLLLLLVLASAVPRDSRPYFIAPILETPTTWSAREHSLRWDSKV